MAVGKRQWQLQFFWELRATKSNQSREFPDDDARKLCSSNTTSLMLNYPSRHSSLSSIQKIRVWRNPSQHSPSPSSELPPQESPSPHRQLFSNASRKDVICNLQHLVHPKEVVFLLWVASLSTPVLSMRHRAQSTEPAHVIHFSSSLSFTIVHEPKH